MIDTFKKKMSLGSLFFISTTIVLGCWVIYRSFILEMTNDEAYSFFNVSTRHLQMMIGTANTHWLNSFFILILFFVFSLLKFLFYYCQDFLGKTLYGYKYHHLFLV